MESWVPSLLLGCLGARDLGHRTPGGWYKPRAKVRQSSDRFVRPHCRGGANSEQLLWLWDSRPSCLLWCGLGGLGGCTLALPGPSLPSRPQCPTRMMPTQSSLFSPTSSPNFPFSVSLEGPSSSWWRCCTEDRSSPPIPAHTPLPVGFLLFPLSHCWSLAGSCWRPAEIRCCREGGSFLSEAPWSWYSSALPQGPPVVQRSCRKSTFVQSCRLGSSRGEQRP